jgi:hypothetical protein
LHRDRFETARHFVRERFEERADQGLLGDAGWKNT